MTETHFIAEQKLKTSELRRCRKGTNIRKNDR
jgi:hypothetical protein